MGIAPIGPPCFSLTLCLVAVTRRDIAYSLVIIWAFIGIAAEQGADQNIVMITWGSAAVVAAAMVASVVYSVIKGTRTLG